MKLRRLLLAVVPMAVLLIGGCRSDPTSTPPPEGGEGKGEPIRETDSQRPVIDTTFIDM
jgi:hypothetical protein